MMGDGWVLDADIIKFEPQAITTLYKHDHGSSISLRQIQRINVGEEESIHTSIIVTLREAAT